MSPYLYTPDGFAMTSPVMTDMIVAGICLCITVGLIILAPRWLLRVQQKQQEVQKTQKRQLLQSLVTMKSLEDELENEMKEALIARAVRNLPTQ